MPDTTTAHIHNHPVPGCFRCELSTDETDTTTTARMAADHWRRWALHHDQYYAAHALCMVLAALDGETRPEHLGIGDDPPEKEAD